MKKNLFLILILNLIIINSIFSAAVSEQIIVDQIGYRINSDKWFMIIDYLVLNLRYNDNITQKH